MDNETKKKFGKEVSRFRMTEYDNGVKTDIKGSAVDLGFMLVTAMKNNPHLINVIDAAVEYVKLTGDKPKETLSDLMEEVERIIKEK
jgi:hypothetical protein